MKENFSKTTIAIQGCQKNTIKYSLHEYHRHSNVCVCVFDSWQKRTGLLSGVQYDDIDHEGYKCLSTEIITMFYGSSVSPAYSGI